MLNIIVTLLKSSDINQEDVPQQGISTNVVGMRLLHKTYQTKS